MKAFVLWLAIRNCRSWRVLAQMGSSGSGVRGEGGLAYGEHEA